MEREHVLKILRHTGNYSEACMILGITRSTLIKKINDYGLREFIESSPKALLALQVEVTSLFDKQER